MKKYWQLRPWMVICAAIFLLLAIVFAIIKIGETGTRFKSYESAGSTMMDYDEGFAMPSSAPAMEESKKLAYSREVSNEMSPRMMIKSGSISLIVDDVRKTADEIIQYTEANKGFLVSSNINKSGINLRGDITIRIPSNLLDKTIDFVKDKGSVENEYIYGQDVTEEYTDIESKLRNLRVTEEQFLKTMQSAVKIEDILAVQRELSTVRQELEVLEGRKKYLKESVELSSLTISLSTNPAVLPVTDDQAKWEPLAIFKDALRSFLDTGKSVINGLIWIGVYLPIAFVLLFIGWVVKRAVWK